LFDRLSQSWAYLQPVRGLPVSTLAMAMRVHEVTRRFMSAIDRRLRTQILTPSRNLKTTCATSSETQMTGFRTSSRLQRQSKGSEWRLLRRPNE
jgi:hypothetical protein